MAGIFVFLCASLADASLPVGGLGDIFSGFACLSDLVRRECDAFSVLAYFIAMLYRCLESSS